MRQLFEHIKKSIYGPAYYQDILTRPFSFSFKYYSAFALLIALFLTVVFSIPLVPKVLDVTREFPQAFFAYYPDELEVRIDKGVASSNVPEPYALPIPPALKEEMGDNATLQSLVVIDTATPFSMEQWALYKSVVWLGKDQIAIMDDNGGVRIESLGPRMDLVVNEGVLRGFEQKLQPFYTFAAPIAVFAIFFGLLVGFSINFLYLVFGAILIFFLGRLLKQRWSYGVSYRIGLHAITLPLLLSMLLSLLNFPSFNFPLLYSTIMLAVVFVNFKGVAPATPLAPLTPTILSASTPSEKP